MSGSRRGRAPRLTNMEPLDRFMAKVDWPSIITGCWPWLAGLDRDGYGIFHWNRERPKLSAHRISYEIARGPIPGDLVVDHLCRVRACVNPAHLELVTRAVNNQRGEPCRINSAKTHCSKGHPFDLLNTYRDDGSRKCKTCNLRISAERKRRIRAAEKLARSAKTEG